MKKCDIKDNVVEMILQVCKYIKSADLSDEEDFEIKVESALSFLMAAIDFTDKPEEHMNYIADQLSKIHITIIMAMSEAAADVVKGNIDESRYL